MLALAATPLPLLWVLLAGIGAGGLARETGRGWSGTLLAGVGYGLSCGVQEAAWGDSPGATAWLAAVLPWLLIVVGRSSAAADPRTRSAWAVVAGGLALALVARAGIAAAPPVAVAGLAWSLGTGSAGHLRRGAPAAGATVVGVLAGALRAGVPQGLDAGGRAVDLVALGVLVLLAGIVGRWRAIAPELGPRTWIAGASVVGLLLVGGLVALGERGLPRTAADLVLPGWVLTVGTRPWIPAALAVPALAALFGGGAETVAGAGSARRGASGALGLVALALVAGVPGVTDLATALRGAPHSPAAWLPVAVLAVALCASDGVVARGRVRVAGAIAALAVAALATAGLHAQTRGRIDPPDELFAALEPGSAGVCPGQRLVGRMSPALPAELVRLELRLVDRDGNPDLTVSDPVRFSGEWLDAASTETLRAEHGLPGDVRLFEVSVPADLRAGLWQARLFVHGPEGELLGERELGRCGRDWGSSLAAWIVVALLLCLPWPRLRVAGLLLG